jgi:hypothetical protein
MNPIEGVIFYYFPRFDKKIDHFYKKLKFVEIFCKKIYS